MEIKRLGHSSFSIKSKQGTVITDPYLIDGLDYPKGLQATIVTVSHGHDDHNNTSAIGGEPLVIEYAGEYEKEFIRVEGFKTYHDKQKGAERGENIMYKITMEGMSVLHCGDLGHTLTKEILEEIGAIDILLIPVGGFYTIDATDAVSVAKDIEASIVIPMHYMEENMTEHEMFKDKLQGVDDFLKKIGQQNVVKEDKLVVTKDMLLGSMRVVLL
jgi:L-ascorbate metabolism protein UlaG (beta-lactamase superfamily)